MGFQAVMVNTSLRKKYLTLELDPLCHRLKGAGTLPHGMHCPFSP